MIAYRFFPTLLVTRLALLSALGPSFLVACDSGGLARLPPAVLETSPDQVDFGQQTIGSTTTQKLGLYNPGEEALDILGVRIDTTDVFRVGDWPSRIAARQRIDVDLFFAPLEAARYAAVLTIESNGANGPFTTIALLGEGVVKTCGACNTPPPPSCINAFERRRYPATGTCVTNECEYFAFVETCPAGCDPTSGSCLVATDAGQIDAATVDAGSNADASAEADAGVDADAGEFDARVQPDSGTEATNNCLQDAGVVDSGLGAPNALFDTPGVHAFTVPENVSTLRIRMWGGGGQGGNQLGATGGGAAFVAGTVDVIPNESLEILVAEGGAGFLGYGGGATFVRRGSTDLLIAGGGGGGGSDGALGTVMRGGRGGAGGLVGEDGTDGLDRILDYCISVTGGRGGTQSAGGAGGTYAGTGGPSGCNGQPGGPGVGGRATGTYGACDPNPGSSLWVAGGGQINGGGGGGGAGYFGGGGAGFIWTYCAGGGGGGSSYADPASTSSVTIVSGQGPAQGRALESFGAGRGGERCTSLYGSDPSCACNAGGNGRVEIRYP